MKVLKFRVDIDCFEQFKAYCLEEGITIKKKLNVLVAQDTMPSDILDYFPENHENSTRKMTLKVNDQLHKGVMKNVDRFELRVRDYLPYLIYKFLLEKRALDMRRTVD